MMGVKVPTYINRFQSPSYIEETILDENDDVIGTVRLKPSTILWKPKNARKFHSVKLEKFIEWIVDKETKARKTAN